MGTSAATFCHEASSGFLMRYPQGGSCEAASLDPVVCVHRPGPRNTNQQGQPYRRRQRSATVEADPEFAIVHIGYRNFAATKDAVFDENTRAAAKILDALLASGLKKTDIETEDIGLRQPESENGDLSSKEREGKRFEANQEWDYDSPPGRSERGRPCHRRGRQ
jgi:Protein of unknown function (DUF541)